MLIYYPTRQQLRLLQSVALNPLYLRTATTSTSGAVDIVVSSVFIDSSPDASVSFAASITSFSHEKTVL